MHRPFQCDQCWRWCDIPDKRFKPCSAKGVPADGKPCKQFDLFGPPRCRDCTRLKKLYRGKTCVEDGRKPEDHACDMFVPRAPGIAPVLQGSPIYMMDGCQSALVKLREAAAVTLIVGNAALIVEHVEGDVFHVTPVRIADDGRPFLRRYTSGADDTIGWRSGNVRVLADDAGVTCGAELTAPRRKPKPKPEPVPEPEPPQEPSEVDEHPSITVPVELDANAVDVQPDVESDEYAPSIFLQEDLPKLAATISDMVQHDIPKPRAMERVIYRYSRAVDLSKDDLDWLRGKLA